jgi:hypothetical protein
MVDEDNHASAPSQDADSTPLRNVTCFGDLERMPNFVTGYVSSLEFVHQHAKKDIKDFL